MPVLENKGKASAISEHFGHAPLFAVYDTEKKKLEIMESKLSHANQERTPVDQLMAYNPGIVYVIEIGQRAINLFREKDVEVKTGNFRTVKEVIENAGALQDVEEGCRH